MLRIQLHIENKTSFDIPGYHSACGVCNQFK